MKAIQDMDYYSPDLLCCELVPLAAPPSFIDSVWQVCLFLLCMPIIAAPLEAIAVLGGLSAAQCACRLY